MKRRELTQILLMAVAWAIALLAIVEIVRVARIKHVAPCCCVLGGNMDGGACDPADCKAHGAITE